MKHTRVKVKAHTYGVGFYSYMCAGCLPIPLERRQSLPPRFLNGVRTCGPTLNDSFQTKTIRAVRTLRLIGMALLAVVMRA